ncbi:helix-turn-helix transcriptional regulator [Streptomyces sp. NPDC058947]|uniref:helix-turn-helix transcriptional regulator n=1 Tax=Streptomyces TaxID=1883 RepID=UPI0036CCF55D
MPGLRREEVALLAGVSSDYYVRLEQGRESSPSPQVVEAVAQALRLDATATDHLNRLCLASSRRPRDRGGRDQVSGQLLELMDGWEHTPAFVLDPAGRVFYQEWERAARSCVAELRAAGGHDPQAERITAVVGELCDASEEFAALWRLHEVKGKSQESKHLRHSEVGDLHIRFAAFTVNGAPHQQLVVYQAEPANPTAAAFEELRIMAMPPVAAPHRHGGACR